MGFTCSDDGLEDLSTAQACIDAVTYARLFNANAYYVEDQSSSIRPKGCYIYDVGAIRFNSHPTGKKQFYLRSICLKCN